MSSFEIVKQGKGVNTRSITERVSFLLSWIVLICIPLSHRIGQHLRKIVLSLGMDGEFEKTPPTPYYQTEKRGPGSRNPCERKANFRCTMKVTTYNTCIKDQYKSVIQK